jgi:polyphosphate kinase 2 (PPK2 family)
MVERTDHRLAPWYLVEGDNKRYARVKVIDTVIKEIEKAMSDRGIDPPIH